MSTLTAFVNVEAEAAFGEPGHPGDADRIIWTARKIGDVLDEAVEWGHRVRRARVHEPFKRAAKQMSYFADDVVEQIVRFPNEKLGQIDKALLTPPGSPDRVLEWKLTIKLTNDQPFSDALDEARAQYRRP